MNKERMLYLADVIEQPRLTPPEFFGTMFNMSNWTSGSGLMELAKTQECGTACCIAGWACLVFGDEKTEIDGESGKKILGLDKLQADLLFHNKRDNNGVPYITQDPDRYGTGGRGGAITREEAASAIRRMVAEG